MWFVVCVVIVLCAIVLFMGVSEDKSQKHLQENVHNLKVKHMMQARDILLSNVKVKFLHSTLVSCYMKDQTPDVQADRAKISRILIQETGDAEVAAAVCALAKIEAKKRKDERKQQSEVKV